MVLAGAAYRPHIALALILGLVVALGIDVKLAHSQTKEADALTAQFTKLYQQGRYSEAIPLAQRILAISEKSLRSQSSQCCDIAEQSCSALPALKVATRTPSRSTSERWRSREGARSRSSRRRDIAEQSRFALPGPGPLRRRRAALQASAGDLREGARSRSSRCCEIAEQPGWALPRLRAATPTPSRSTSERWRSARRRSVPIIPTSRRR